MRSYDVAIIGGGCVGLATAKGLIESTDLDIAVFEKEPELGQHQSGRNSGVLHPGFNYKPGSRKAEFAVEGTRRLKSFAREHDVPLEELGVAVVATSEQDEDNLEILFDRADANGVTVERLRTHEEIVEREPHAAGRSGLWCPEAASIDAPAYVDALGALVEDAGVDIAYDTVVQDLNVTGDRLHLKTGADRYTAAHVVNAAGQYADRFAHQLGVGQSYRIVPFRGEYYTLTPERRQLTRSMIYPVPDPEIPFLGVHFTRRTDGSVIVGPNAVLAPGREAYRNREFDLGEVAEMALDPGIWRLLKDRTRRHVAMKHLHTSLRKPAFVGAAKELVPSVTSQDLRPGHAGIRAQLVGDDGSLIMRPLVEGGPSSTHVLNAVSPGLTTSLPFGEYIAQVVQDSLTQP